MTDATGSFDPLDYFRAGRRRIAITACLGVACGVAYGFLAPKWYRAELTVVPSASPKGGVGSLGGLPAALGSAIDLPTDLLGGADVDRIAAVFESKSVTDAVIAKFDLLARYDLIHIEDVRKEVWKHCSIKLEKKPGLVTVSCEDKDPETARAIVDYFGEVGNQVMRRVSRSSAGEERRFLEERVNQARADLDSAARTLRDFQEKNRIVSLPEQAKAVVGSIASIRAELIEKQLQLAVIKGFSAHDGAEAGQLRRQVAVLDAKLKALERSTNAATQPEPVAAGVPGERRTQVAQDGTGLFPPAMNVPGLQYELERVMRKQKIEETLFMLLTQRFEMARVNEARDTSTFQILDRPTLPTKKARPQKVFSAIIGLILGLAAGLGMALAPRWMRPRGRHAAPASPSR